MYINTGNSTNNEQKKSKKEITTRGICHYHRIPEKCKQYFHASTTTETVTTTAAPPLATPPLPLPPTPATPPLPLPPTPATTMTTTTTTPFYNQWENFLLRLDNGPTFPAHLRVALPDTIFLNDFGYPTNHFCSDSSYRLTSKTSTRLTLEQVCATLTVRLRAAEIKLQEHLSSRTETQRKSPIRTPPTVRVALIGSAITGCTTNDKNNHVAQNSRTLLLTADAFEEICKRWQASEVEKQKSLPRCLQLMKVEPQTGVSYITCLVQPGFSPFSVTVATYKVLLSHRLGLVAEQPIKQVVKGMVRLISKNNVAIRLKRSIVGLATQIGKTHSKKSSKIHGLVLEFIVTEDSHVELTKVLGTHYRGEKPSWSNPASKTKEEKAKERRRTKQRQAVPEPVAAQTHDDLLCKALMSKMYAETATKHSKRLDDGGGSSSSSAVVSSAQKTAERQQRLQSKTRKTAPTTSRIAKVRMDHVREQPTKPTQAKRIGTTTESSSLSTKSNEGRRPGRTLREPSTASKTSKTKTSKTNTSKTKTSNTSNKKNKKSTTLVGAKIFLTDPRVSPPSNPSHSIVLPVATPQHVDTTVADLQKQLDTERGSMLRALSDAQARGDALAQHLDSQQRQLRELRTQLLEATDENQHLKQQLDSATRETTASNQELLLLRANGEKMVQVNAKNNNQLEKLFTATNALLNTSGANFYLQKEAVNEVVKPNMGGPSVDNNEAGNMLLLLRLKVVEHLASLKECFLFYATAMGGTGGFYPKHLRVLNEDVERLIVDADVASKTFSKVMALQILSSVCRSPKNNNKNLGVSFPLFVVWLVQLAQSRYHRFNITPAEKLNKLIVNNIDLALMKIPESSCSVPSAKEKWGALSLDS